MKVVWPEIDVRALWLDAMSGGPMKYVLWAAGIVVTGSFAVMAIGLAMGGHFNPPVDRVKRCVEQTYTKTAADKAMAQQICSNLVSPDK